MHPGASEHFTVWFHHTWLLQVPDFYLEQQAPEATQHVQECHLNQGIQRYHAELPMEQQISNSYQPQRLLTRVLGRLSLWTWSKEQ